ncbi:MAG: DUF3168 domain-containing protein [Gammaproteobacteria bacterium]|nr:DUF3168 domain-containing protein [Gammaproteobacteria bacterium]
MSAETGIYTHLSTDGNIIALVGTRIYPEWMPQESDMPAIVFSLTSAPREPNFDGPSAYVDRRYQLDCYASTYSAAKSLADAVRVSLDGVTGTLGGENVQLVSLEDERDLSDIEGDTAYRRVSMDFLIVVN